MNRQTGSAFVAFAFGLVGIMRGIDKLKAHSVGWGVAYLIVGGALLAGSAWQAYRGRAPRT